MAGPLIRSKTRVPAVDPASIIRARVIDAVARAATGRRVLQVVAPAGSGKTTAVVQYLATRPGPRAWLTLGEADGSPGRLATYLAAAVGGIDPAVPEDARDMLEHGVAPADCAALMAERLPPGAALVIDDVHLVESRPPALAVLRALVDAVAPEALVVLVSRRLIHLDLSRSVLTGACGIVRGDDLSFTPGEAGELLAARGVEPAASAIPASGGWAAGIVFDALRGTRPPGGPGAPDDPFFAYLGAEVLGTLPADLRRVVIRSAVLDTVDAAGLEAVVQVPSGAAALRAIGGEHLPATVEPEGLRYHPRFREFLLSRLGEDPAERRALLVRHARLLGSRGQCEEAADHLLDAGETHEAEAMIEAATPALVMRGDWDKVLAWCDAVGEDALSRRASLRGCQLRALVVGRRGEATEVMQALRASGEYDRLVHEDPDAATTAVLGLYVHMNWASLPALLPPDDAAPGARAMRYLLHVGSGLEPPRPWSPDEVDRLARNIGLLQWAFYLQGRFADVEAMAAIEPGRTSAGRWHRELYRVAALRRLGRLGDARAAFDAAADARASGFGDFWRHEEAELVFAEGDRERGLALVREARAMTRALGHEPADNAIFAVSEGRMLVRLGRVDEAVELLRATRAWCRRRGLPCFREWADTWLAAALLRRGDAPGEAIGLLETAIEGMQGAERTLELPAALVTLAEARWRAGDAAGHDRAADAAREAAEEMGAFGPLLTVLADLPEVAARRVERGGPDAGTWRTLAGSTDPVRGASEPGGVRILLGTLGWPRIEVDGAECDAAPARALEVAAVVARAGDEGVSRTAVAEQVMEDSTDAFNYLRQVVHRLRRLSPEGVELVSDGNILRWRPPGAVMTEDQLLLALLARARREVGSARRATLARALELADRGPLATSDQGMAARRLAEELVAAVFEARCEYSELLLGAGRAPEALAAARASVAAEPYREDGWRLLMRAAAAAAGGSAAVPVYLECVRSLGTIGLGPSGETVALLDRLRDPVPAPAAAERVIPA